MEELESINGFDSSIDFEKQIFARLQVIQELQWVINLVEGDAKKAKRPGLNSMEGYIKRQA